MKFTSQFSRSLFVLVTLALSLSACVQDNVLPVNEGISVDQRVEAVDVLEEEDVNYVDETGLGYEAEIVSHLDDHGVNLDQIEEVEMHYPDGTSETKYLVDGDIVLSKEELTEVMEMMSTGQKQYRTSALVSAPQTISVIGYTGGSYALTSKMRTALSWAINNYNALNTGLNFTLSFRASTNADIVVYRNFTNSGAGGSAGFPSGGNPYKWVQIYAGTNNYSTNVVEHVMTHEIGHCLGLRHTDYFSRASCGQNVNEGSAGVGAIHIPGTPTGIDWNSVMLACFSSSEDGEFGFYDRVALEYLY